MLSRLQELKKEEETLLKIKAALHDQLNRLKVEELALQSMINARGDDDLQYTQEAPEEEEAFMVDNEKVINQTELQLGTVDDANNEEEMEEEDESDS